MIPNPDPEQAQIAVTGSDEERLIAFRRVRDQLRAYLAAFARDN